MEKQVYRNWLFLLLIAFLINSCGEAEEKEEIKETDKAKKTSLTVTATAYNSVASQTTKKNVDLAAWGDTLIPGDCVIAVSRDLIKKGLDHNTEVEIEGLPGTYVVKDKMNRRWENKIDIYMGLNKKAARQWGRKKVKIWYEVDEQVEDE